jgi:hypothetical protein
MSLIPEVTSLLDLYYKSKEDSNYEKLAKTAASNMGMDAWAGKGVSVMKALEYLNMIADESGDEVGVVAEVNFCRDLI